MMQRTLLAGLLLVAGAHCAVAAEPALTAWNEGKAKQAIENWVAGATKPGSKTFIPANQRHVVFDNDGTLWPEAPVTFQIQFIMDEIKRLNPLHPEWKSDALIQAVLHNDMKTVMGSDEEDLMRLLALTQSGMTTDEFSQRVSTWINTHRHVRFGCRYDQLGYQPMRQLLDYLRENGFRTWIVSGGGIDFMRVLTEKMYGIPPEQVIGSFSLSEFSLTDNGTQLRKTMQGAFNNDGSMKPVAINLFMGRRPVGAFGNSDGDVPMIQYTSANHAYKTLGLLIHHTDGEREYAYDTHPPASGKLVSGLKLAPGNNWVVVDMKQDWKTVFDPAQCSTQSAPND